MNTEAPQPTNPGRCHVTVIGAGIVGITCAYDLRKEGHDVTVLDREPPGQGCSFGNAGLLARSSFMPVGGPGTLLAVPGYLLDPLGPLAIRWSYLPRMLPWLLRYIRSCAADNVHAAAAALQVLTDPTVDEFEKLAAEIGRSDLVQVSDYLYVFESQKAFGKMDAEIRFREAKGTKVERLVGDQIHVLEPDLADRYRYAYQILDHGFTYDPEGLVKALAEAFVRAGGEIRQCEVRDVEIGPDGPTGVVTDQGTLAVEKLVVAAGAFSGPFAERVGAPVPLDTERGYHVTLPDPGVRVSRPIMSGEGHFLVTPMAMGLRIAGTVEFAGVHAPPNYARARVLLTHGRRMFPGLNTDDHTEWMGRRPTLPDSLPVIGHAPKFANVVLAFGHQHVGLTCAPRTAKIVSDLIGGRTPNIDLSPYRADRF